MGEAASDPNRVWQVREQARLVAFYCIGMSIVMLFAALLPVGMGGRAFTLTTAAFIGGGWFFRLRPSGVQLSGGTVIVRNPFRTQSFALAEVVEFSNGRSGMFPRIGLLHLRDGRSVHIFAIQNVSPLWSPHVGGAEDVVAELNATLDSVRDGNGRRAKGMRQS